MSIIELILYNIISLTESYELKHVPQLHCCRIFFQKYSVYFLMSRINSEGPKRFLKRVYFDFLYEMFWYYIYI